MPSSSRPYKSKLLRFVLQQWQQGLDRQDRAWRQLKSTSTWSAQVAIFPIYAIVRAIERASLILDSDSSKPDQSPQAVTAAKTSVTDIDHSFAAILTHTQQLLSSEHITQPDIDTEGGFIRRAQSLLTNAITRIRQQLPAKSHGSSRSAALTQVQPRSASIRKPQHGLTTTRSYSIRRRAASGLLQNGMTLASSIKQQQLVLVNADNEVFDILTTEEQGELKHYILRIMIAYQQSRMITPRQPKRLSTKTVLAIGAVFIAALPAELKKAWSKIAPGPQLPHLPPLSTNSPEPKFHVFYPSSSTANTVKTRAHRLPSRTSKPKSTHQLYGADPYAFEADVNDIDYLEHPLERVLRWIDRVLTWCEHRWKQWLGGKANMG
ncbi:MAG: hypothetical protein AAGI69_20560 [Cyanobacteria bacterium P01_H01_bin.21]